MKKTAITNIFPLWPALFFLLAPAFSYGGEMSFSSAVSRLYGSNETIAASNEDINQRRMEKKAALGLFFPTLSLNAGYVHFNDDLKMDVDLSSMKDALAPLGQINPAIGAVLQGFPSSMSQTIQKENLFMLTASAVWPVFTGGKILAANRAASIQIERAEAAGNSAKSKLASQLAALYFGVRLADDVATVKKEVYDAMKSHYEKAVKMEKAGVLARVERMHAEVALSEAERGYRQALRDAELSAAALKSILNADEDITPSTPLFIVPADSFQPLSYFQEQAVASNPDIKQLEAGQRLTDTAVSARYATFLPSVFLFGNADILSYDKSDIMPDWMVGIGLTYTIFEGFGGYNSVRAAKAAQKSFQLTKIRAEKDIKTLVEQQYITIENARADYEAVRASLAFTEEYLRARTRAFDQGMASSLDVVDAELALSGAKMSAIAAAYKFDIAMAKLLETSGLFDYFEDYRSKATVELGL